MKGLVIEGPGRVSLESLPDPRLHDARGAVVGISCCSICGSDLHLYHEANGNEPYCIGHEAIGEVVEIGSEVSGFRPGDRVLVMASVGCGRCQPCKQGHTMLCENAPRSSQVFGQGLPGLGGCQAEGIAVPEAETNLIRMPPSVSDDVAMLLCDSMATAWFCARRGGIEPGNTVAVIGQGPVGQQAVLAARAMEAGRIFAIDPVETRRAVGMRFGAEPLDPDEAVRALREATQGRGVDVVLDCAGGAATTKLSVRVAGKGGRISVIGVSEEPHIPFPVVEALVKNIDWRGGLTSIQYEVPLLLKALEAGALDAADLESLVTHRMGLSEGPGAYALFDRRAPGVGKIVFDPSR